MSLFEFLISVRRFVLTSLVISVFAGVSRAEPVSESSDAVEKAGEEQKAEPAPVEKKKKEKKKEGEKKTDGKEADVPAEPEDKAAPEKKVEEVAAVAKPVSPDRIQIYGWREYIVIKGVKAKLKAKLDTGARTSSIHAEEKELFERDGKKWVRFVVMDPSLEKPERSRIEAPLIRIARVKEPGPDTESEAREVVRLSFQIGDRNMRGEFTLNNRENMLAPVLIGRTMIKNLGWVDPSRIYLAEKKVFR